MGIVITKANKSSMNVLMDFRFTKEMIWREDGYEGYSNNIEEGVKRNVPCKSLFSNSNEPHFEACN